MKAGVGECPLRVDCRRSLAARERTQLPLREKETECSQSADCQHISRRQPSDFARLSKITASRTIRAGTRVRLLPSRRWGGRRIQRPDVGGLWSSDEARGKDTSGVLAEVDGWPAPARRALPVRAAVSCPPRADGSNVIGGDPVRPEARAASRRARGKRLRGAGLLRRNGQTIKAPGEARPPRALPAPPRKQAAKSLG